MTEMFEYVNPRNGQYAPLIADDVYKVIQDNAEFLDSHIIYNRDFNYDYLIQNIRTFLFA
jgi:ribonucleoside-diphosphate reductase alpha chain